MSPKGCAHPHNDAMELSALGPPATVWQRWTLVAAGEAARGGDGAEIRRVDGCAHLAGPDGAWLRMRRMVGDRAVLWGHHPGLPSDARFTDELRDMAPDWAWEPDTAHALREVGFLAWHAHGQWWSVPSPVPDVVVPLLADVSSHTRLLERWQTRWPDAGEDQLRAVMSEPDRASFARLVPPRDAARAARQVELGRGWTTQQLSQTATAHLRAQVHAQMRSCAELSDRGHPPRPPLVRQWARVNAGTTAFRHAVSALGAGRTPGLVASEDDNGLTEPQVRSLDNVLLELRMEETDPVAGAWMFARVTGDGRTVSLERAYDSWPRWYVAPGNGPTMGALHDEMAERSYPWRPRWSALLPTDRF